MAISYSQVPSAEEIATLRLRLRKQMRKRDDIDLSCPSFISVSFGLTFSFPNGSSRRYRGSQTGDSVLQLNLRSV